MVQIGEWLQTYLYVIGVKLQPDPNSQGISPETIPCVKRCFLRFLPAKVENYENSIRPLIAPLVCAPLVFKTPAGLLTPGSVASYKVYVILKTGGEAGSNNVTVTRPL